MGGNQLGREDLQEEVSEGRMDFRIPGEWKQVWPSEWHFKSPVLLLRSDRETG